MSKVQFKEALKQINRFEVSIDLTEEESNELGIKIQGEPIKSIWFYEGRKVDFQCIEHSFSIKELKSAQLKAIYTNLIKMGKLKKVDFI